MVERGDNTNYSLFFQDFSEKSPKQTNEHGDTYFFIQSLDSSRKYLCKNMFLLFQLHSLICLFCILMFFGHLFVWLNLDFA